jgi:hypothetical protein
VVTIDTTKMSTSLTFALCYAESNGLAADTWTDTGIRLTVSKIILRYGPASTSFPVREWHSPNIMPAINRLPQVTNAIVTYYGELVNYKWLSFVDAALNSNNPCVDGTIPTADEDTTHSFALRAQTGTKNVIVPQGTLLDVSKTFAVCYAEVDGTATDSTWRDSYVRVKISKIETFSSHSITHKTDGSIAKTSALKMTYGGSHNFNRWVSLVDKTLNNNFPCALGSVAATAAAALASPPTSAYSGVVRAGLADKDVIIDTTKMSSSLTFALCYAESTGLAADTWTDTGIRLTVSKINLKYGPASTSFPVREWHSPNIMPAINRLPQVAARQVTYYGELDNYKWLSFVDAALNGNNPCVFGAVAAATADSTHSGAQRAGSGTKVVTIPQTTLLDASKTFAVCYSETYGNATDSSWRDSYVRVKISKIETLSSHSITHFTDGSIAKTPALKLTYAGSLANNKYVSFADALLNNKFPCAQGSVAAASVATSTASSTTSSTAISATSGVVQAGLSDKVISVDTTKLRTSQPPDPKYTLSFGNPVTSAATPVTFLFSAIHDLAIGDAIALTMPNFTFATLSTPSTSGCGSTTFTAVAVNSTTSIATLHLTVASAKLPAGVQCAVSIATGITTTAAPQVANLNSRTVGIKLAGSFHDATTDISATAIGTSTAIAHPSVSLSRLTIANPKSSYNTSISLTFSLTSLLAAADTIAIVLPTFTLATPLANPTTSGCGSTTFTAAATNSSTAAATVTLTAATATLTAGTQCTVTISTGVKASAAAQAANLATRTVAVTLAGATNIAPTAIASSTAVIYPTPAIFSSKLTITNPVTSAPTSISFMVSLNEPLAVADTIAIVLPTFTLATLETPT